MGGKSLMELLLARVRAMREASGLTHAEMDERLVLGPGWSKRLESGETRPSIDVIAAMLYVLGKNFNDLIDGWETEEPTVIIERAIRAEESQALVIHFQYADHDAQYTLQGATLAQFTEVLKVLRDGLASSNEDPARLSSAVMSAFIRAVELWPHANPSDIWYFIIYRAYLDPYNHPAQYARKDFGASWKRTGGWALEKIIVEYYKAALKRRGINIQIGSVEQKQQIIESLGLPERLEADKIDIILTGDDGEHERFFGIVNVKASIAERRTDDVPMSEALIRAGYTSVLSTMDCKATPSTHPKNRGELGVTLSAGRDRRSAKRKDVEENASFSACFSYNQNTKPTPEGQQANARIYVLDFNHPEDDFVEVITAAWERYRTTVAKGQESSEGAEVA